MIILNPEVKFFLQRNTFSFILQWVKVKSFFNSINFKVSTL